MLFRSEPGAVGYTTVPETFNGLYNQRKLSLIHIFTTGGELGVYNKTTNRETEFYDCASDEDMLNLSLIHI